MPLSLIPLWRRCRYRNSRRFQRVIVGPASFACWAESHHWGLELDSTLSTSAWPANRMTNVYRLNIRTGKRVLWKEILPPNPAGFTFYFLLLTASRTSTLTAGSFPRFSGGWVRVTRLALRGAL